MDGRAGAPKKTKNVKPRERSAGAADDQDFSKIARSKKRSFRPPQTNGRADGNQNKASLRRQYHTDVMEGGHFVQNSIVCDLAR